MTRNESSWPFYHAEWAEMDAHQFMALSTVQMDDDFWGAFCAGGEL